MIVALLSVGALATPVTGLIIRPDAHGARHGMEMFVDLGRFAWYGYLAVSALVLAFALTGLFRHTPRAPRRAYGAAVFLLVIMPVFGGIHVLSVATGVDYGDGQPLLAAVSAVVTVAAMVALATARARLLRSG